jgi:protein ImuB
MSFVCLWSPAWRIGAGSSPAAPNAVPDLTTLAAVLLGAAPRVVAERRTNDEPGRGAGRTLADDAASALLWADAHGLDAIRLATTLLDLLRDHGIADARAGIASAPIAAELAAASGEWRRASETENPSLAIHHAPFVTRVLADRAFLASAPIAALDPFSPDPRLRTLLFGIGVTTCGELAALDRESVEVRLGGGAVPLWRLARADDRRVLFAPMPRELPHASFDCIDYTLSSSEQLLFIINRLARRVTEALTAGGEGARELALAFALEDGTTHREVIRSSRPTANRSTWTRLIRTRLERLTLHEPVTGVAVQVVAAAMKESRQGDLFDRGFATAQATDDALARLVDDQGAVVVVPTPSAHPLLDRRDAPAPHTDASDGVQPVDIKRGIRPLRTRKRRELAGVAAVPTAAPRPALTLQLIEPRVIDVRTVARRDHHVPVRYGDDGRWHEVVDVAGPDRISGGHWDAAYAREYFRCVTGAGLLVWIFRDARTEQWYLHGWWD